MNNISLGENQITLFYVWIKKGHLIEKQKVDFERRHVRTLLYLYCVQQDMTRCDIDLNAKKLLMQLW